MGGGWGGRTREGGREWGRCGGTRKGSVHNRAEAAAAAAAAEARLECAIQDGGVKVLGHKASADAARVCACVRACAWVRRRAAAASPSPRHTHSTTTTCSPRSPLDLVGPWRAAADHRALLGLHGIYLCNAGEWVSGWVDGFLGGAHMAACAAPPPSRAATATPPRPPTHSPSHPPSSPSSTCQRRSRCRRCPRLQEAQGARAGGWFARVGGWDGGGVGVGEGVDGQGRTLGAAARPNAQTRVRAHTPRSPATNASTLPSVSAQISGPASIEGGR